MKGQSDLIHYATAGAIMIDDAQTWQFIEVNQRVLDLLFLQAVEVWHEETGNNLQFGVLIIPRESSHRSVCNHSLSRIPE